MGRGQVRLSRTGRSCSREPFPGRSSCSPISPRASCPRGLPPGALSRVPVHTSAFCPGRSAVQRGPRELQDGEKSYGAPKRLVPEKIEVTAQMGLLDGVEGEPLVAAFGARTRGLL